MVAGRMVAGRMGAGGGALAALGRIVVALVAMGVGSAHAGHDTEPVIVVPGRPGVPIIVDGQDVRGAVIEGEWGLARGHTGLTIIRPRSMIYPGSVGRSMYTGQPVGRFFPGTGREPRMGRREVIPPPNRVLPPRAESFERRWSSESQPLPPTSEQMRFPLPLVGVTVDPKSRKHGPNR
jgi:hypothetical protein